MGESVAAARDVSHVTKLRSYKRVLGPSPHVFKSLPTSYRLIHRFCNYTDKRNSDSVSMSYLVWDIESIPTSSTRDSGIRSQETVKLACKALTVLSKHQIFLDIIFYSPQTSPLLFFPPKSTVCYPGNVVSEDIHP